MKLLPHKECKRLAASMSKAAQGGPASWDPWHRANNREAIVYLPCGEIMNEGIRGFVWAWHMQNRIVHVPTSEQSKIGGLNANGLEGLISVETDLCVALLVFRELAPHRCRIKA